MTKIGYYCSIIRYTSCLEAAILGFLPGISRPGISRDPAIFSFPESREISCRDPGKFGVFLKPFRAFIA
jgi:hypothetical protein